MKIIIYGINYDPELVGIGKYTGEMCAWLAKEGHEVRVVTAQPYYPDWKVWPKFSKWLYTRSMSDDVTIWRCPLFVPAQPRALLRILHLASFALTSIPALMIQVFWRPQVVFLVAPTLFCFPGALFLAKLTKATSILHIQDFEVDAFFGLDLVASQSKTSIFKRFAFYFESLVLSCFDLVCTISVEMMHRAQEKGVAPECLQFLPNWSEIARFKNIGPSQKLLNQLGVVQGNKKIILYSGNMGEKQGLESVVLAAQQLKARNDLIFLMVGEGASKYRLINMVEDLNLTNVVFLAIQSYEDFPSLLASADVHLVIQKRGVADAVLPSKLTNILAVGGNAVITADTSTALGKLPLNHPGIAVVVEPESVEDLVFGIEAALRMPYPNQVAQDYAEKFLDKDRVLTRFFRELQV